MSDVSVSTTTQSTVSELRPGAITRTTLALFAGASGDHNPIHIDLDAAQAAGAGDVFAHGMLTMAYLGRALTNWIPQRRIVELSGRFTAITPVLAEPVITAEVTEIEEIDGVPHARVDLVATLADGTVTLRGKALVTWL
ncbi:MaoC/PaaZ C-terminal domain-containing protein [Nocardia sp. alder85J]|uniref:MaoC/PaaZ C-terminal domain-containing protein n=1 Tax=Nocardia sp. alder85J TaxID=2862949 RepID=UPI001CD4091D|nr:MaoC/PaaZ C-terminal domain-containing protein [Nocardia sp. alder85J]MCX4095829.1 MaoC/PaaZ C-terminal domain-containing protein [Nocardia sp. alder85J]